ncbi:MAG: response regulator [Eubacteriales bacterium]
MLKVIAVDDEWHALERFELLAQEMGDMQVCGLFETAEELKLFLQTNHVDAIFLDIEMPDQKGLSLAADILDMDSNTEIVFITAYKQYALEAFECNALDYILKPLTARRLQKTVDRLKKISKHDETKGKPYVRCFGSFEIFMDGQAVTWRNLKAREVLAFLVHKEGVPVSWEIIADAVWPEYNFDKAHVNFHSTMYLLRKRLVELGIGQILECARGNYRVRTDMIRCDYYESKEGRGKHPYGKGYMEENGYIWAYERAAEIEK